MTRVLRDGRSTVVELAIGELVVRQRALIEQTGRPSTWLRFRIWRLERRLASIERGQA